MEVKKGQFGMLPPAPDKCQICAAKAHDDEMPHNRDSLYYQFWFNANYGRSPTWADASMLCSEDMKKRLKAHLLSHGVKPEVIGNL